MGRIAQSGGRPFLDFSFSMLIHGSLNQFKCFMIILIRKALRINMCWLWRIDCAGFSYAYHSRIETWIIRKLGFLRVF